MIARGFSGKCSFTSSSIRCSGILFVPFVSTSTDTGAATPIAYATWTSHSFASPAATMFFAM